MDKFIIRGGNKLNGTVRISGSKNTSLALMPATILAGGQYTFYNTPELRDVITMSRLLRTMGLEIQLKEHTLRIDTTRINKFEAPY